MEEFRGKIAIVTGAASGIGKSITDHLIRYGATVYATDIQFRGAESDEGILKKIYLDVTDAVAVQRVVNRVLTEQGRLNYIFNNAGFAVTSEIRDMTVEQWRDIFNLNVMGVVNGVMAAYPAMIRQHTGHIVNTASLAGVTYTPSLVAYSSTKHAVVALSMGLRAEGAKFGVKVTALCPGFIRTNIYDAAVKNNISTEAVMETIKPLGLLEVDDTVEKMLKGVAKNKALVVLPAYGKIMWYITRFSPALANLLGKPALKRFRQKRSGAN